jgi:hypothetical protein
MKVAVGKKLGNGGVSISVNKILKYIQTSIKHQCNAQNSEFCAVPLEPESSNIYVLAIQTAPTGDSEQFPNKLENTWDYCGFQTFFIIIHLNCKWVFTRWQWYNETLRQ